MKKGSINLVIIFILVLFSVLSCEKQPFDYRNKYLGSWKFDISERREWYSVTRGFYDSTSTRTCIGEIKYGTDHDIMFQGSGFSREFNIDRKGNIVSDVDQLPNYSESGGFEGTSIFKYHYYHHWGATRQYTGTDINGERD